MRDNPWISTGWCHILYYYTQFLMWSIPEAFEHFPALEKLELSLNGLIHLSISEGSFGSLTHLDLSYNNLSLAAVTMLGVLPALTELHLTGTGERETDRQTKTETGRQRQRERERESQRQSETERQRETEAKEKWSRRKGGAIVLIHYDYMVW